VQKVVYTFVFTFDTFQTGFTITACALYSILLNNDVLFVRIRIRICTSLPLYKLNNWITLGSFIINISIYVHTERQWKKTVSHLYGYGRPKNINWRYFPLLLLCEIRCYVCKLAKSQFYSRYKSSCSVSSLS